MGAKLGKRKTIDKIDFKESKSNMTIPCSQEGRIAHIETLVEVKLDAIEKELSGINTRLDKIEVKLNNGLTDAVRKNTEYRHKQEDKELSEQSEENKDRRQSKWQQLPLWKKIGVITGIAVFLFRPEVKEILTLLLKHYFNM